MYESLSACSENTRTLTSPFYLNSVFRLYVEVSKRDRRRCYVKNVKYILFYMYIRVCVSRYSVQPRGGSLSPGSCEIFLFSTSFRPVLGPTHRPIQWVPRALSPEIRWPGREADHSPPTSDEVKNTWIYTYISTPPYAFMA
jgi:hypothetical protein